MDIAELSNILSEAGVVSTLIYHPEFISHTDYLKPNHFYQIDNACLFWSIQELFKEGITNIDAYNISNKLRSHDSVRKTIEKYNLPSIQKWIDELKLVARHTLEEYKAFAEDVFTLAFKRKMVQTLDEMRANCFNPNYGLEELSNISYGELDTLARDFIAGEKVRTFGEKIDEIWDEIVSRRSADGIYGIPSKFPSFMEYFTYEPGELVLIQAKYKQGKSMFLMNEAVHMLKNGQSVLVVDSEMSTRLYTERLLSHLTGIEIKRIKSGRYSETEAEKIREGIEWLKQQPFVHIYDPNMTLDKMYSICKILQGKINLSFVVYDYLKSNETSTSDNYNVLGSKCDYLKNKIAGELDLPVLAACQLNRQGEVADSAKINMYLSVGIKWGYKTQDMIIRDGVKCGNSYAKIYINRLGEQTQEDDEESYIDFTFNGSTATIVEAEKHNKTNVF